MSDSFELNTAKFAAEIFEREVVVLDLIEGIYYALGGSAKEIWPHLIGHRPLAQIAADVAHAHDVALADVNIALKAFSERLLDEGILRSAGAAVEGGTAFSPLAGDFVPPTVEKHVEMQDLLTLDPIHDVDPDSGWPRI